MKFLLLASFVIVCTASTVYRNRNISVNDDGNILITSPNGRRVVISRQLDSNGQRNIDISISGPNIPTKTIQVNDNNFEDAQIGNTPWSSIDTLGEESRLKRGSSKSQGDVLAEILREYQGVVDEAQYEKLLNKINKAVKKGEISPQVYDLLEEFDQQQQQQQQQQGQNVVYGQGSQQGQVQGQIYGVPGYYRGYGYQTQGQAYNQIPSNYYYNLLRGQYGTRYANPSGQSVVVPYSQRYFADLLANQQLNGGLQTFWGRFVPQRTSSILGDYSPLLRQLFGHQQYPYSYQQYPYSDQQYPYGYQQYPYTQRQLVATPQVYGGQQRLGYPQSYYQQQQQQQREQLEQVEEALKQLSEVEQQLQQQQQAAEVQQAIETIEQLNEIQQQQQVQPIVQQRVPYAQVVRQQAVGQTRGLPQYTVGQVGRVSPYSYTQPIYRAGYRTAQPVSVQGRTGTYYNTVPQAQPVY